MKRKTLINLLLSLGLVIAGLLLAYAATANAGASQHAPADEPCSYLIGNGGFETGDFSQWQTLGSPLVVDDQHSSGSYSALAGAGDNHDDTFLQMITIPGSATSADVTFWYYIETEENYITAYDHLYVEVLDSLGTVLATLQTLDNTWPLEEWRQSSFDLMQVTPDLLGRTVHLAFHAITDSSNLTSFYIDDVDLIVCEGICHSFSGHTKEGSPGNTTGVIPGVTVRLDQWGDGGWQLQEDIQSDANGEFAFEYSYGRSEFRIVETDPAGYTSTGAYYTIPGGNHGTAAVVSSNEVRFDEVPCGDTIVTFWDEEVPSCPDDDYEPNDSFDDAVFINAEVEHTAYICPDSDEDWFKFYVVGQEIAVDLYGPDEELPANFDLYLYSPSGEPLDESSAEGTDPEQILHAANEIGDYRIRIVGYEGTYSDQSPYRMTLQMSAPPCDDVIVLEEQFESGYLPPDWSNVDNLSQGYVWRFDDLGGRGNLTGAAGDFAIVDSDYYGVGNNQDTELWTSSLDLSEALRVTLAFDTHFRAASDEFADVDVSTDGGNTWSNVWRKSGADYGPARETIDLSSRTVGQPDVMVRFHYSDAGYAWWWQVDNVQVLACMQGGYGVSVTPSTDSKSGDPGDTVTYVLEVINTGNTADTFDVSVSGNAWTTNAPATVGPLAAGVGTSINVTVDIPAGASGGDSDTATVTVTSQGDGSESDSSILTTTANNVYGVSVTPSTDSKSGDPGDTVTYVLEVINTGNTADTFDVSVSGSVWTTNAPATVGPLAAGAGTSINVTVDIPAGASGGDSDTATVTVTSQGDSSESDSSILTTTANNVYGVSVTPSTDSKSGDPGDTVTYVLEIINTGNTPDTFDVSVSGSPWTTNAPATAGPLAAGAGASINVTVDIPAGASGGDSDTATVTVTSQGDSSESDSSTLTSTANNVYGVSVTPSTDSKSGDPGDTVTYMLQVTNTGNTADTFDVSVSGSAWTTNSPSTVGPLPAGASTNINVTVDILVGAAGGDSETATVTVTSQGDGKWTTSMLTTTANYVYGVEVHPPTGAKASAPGVHVLYTLQVTNTGNTTDTFGVSISGNTWTTNAPAVVGPLSLGKSSEIDVAVTISGSAADHERDTAAVKVTSQADSIMWATSVLTTTARVFSVVSAAPPPNNHTATVTTNMTITVNSAVRPTNVTTQTLAVHGGFRGYRDGTFGVSSIGSDSSRIVFDPNTDFHPGELVETSVTTDVMVEDIPLVSPYVWQFRAAAGVGCGHVADSGQELGNASSYGVALGDLNGDGDLDAFVANYGSNAVWQNDGTGAFTTRLQSLGASTSMDVALGDVDGDGDLDAFVANYGNVSGEANKVWLNDGGRFSPGWIEVSPLPSQSRSVALGDLDGDGDLDAFVANDGQANKVWLNQGGVQGGVPGIFSDSGQWLGSSDSYGVALGDLDSDGDLDAFVANDGQANKVWLNDGRGKFNDSRQNLGSEDSKDVALGDLDGDGDLDAFVANDGEADMVWLNQGGVQAGAEGSFSDSGQSLGSQLSQGMALGDLDGDGDLDAFVANWNQADSVWLNNGTGLFELTTQTLGRSASTGVALGNLDEDSDIDAFVANWDQTNKVWLNRVHGLALSPDHAALSGDPDTIVTYTLGVTNTGETDDRFDVAFSGDVWPTKAQTPVGPLTAGASTNIVVTVDIPAGAAGDDSDTATVKVTSQADNSRWATSALTTTANRVYGLTLLPAHAALSGDPGTTVIYELQVVNTGNITDTFDVSVSGNDWTTGAPAPVGLLAAGAGANINITVGIPAGAAGGDSDVVTVRVTSRGDNSKWAVSDLTTTANCVYGIEVYPPTNTKASGLGTVVTYTLQVTNTGNTTDTIDVLVRHTWPVAAPTSIASLPAKTGRRIDVTVGIPNPPDAHGGDSDTATVTLKSQGNPSQSAASVLMTTVPIAQGVAVTPRTSAKIGAPGVHVTYTLQVTNTGNTIDTFSVSVSNTGWMTTVLGTLVGPLAPGKSGEIDVGVTIPGNAADGDKDTATVKVTSQADTNTWAASILTTTARVIRVVSAAPPPNSHRAALTTNLTVTVNSAVGPTSVTTRTIVVHGGFQGHRDGSFSISGAGSGSSRVVFDPAADFHPGELVETSVTTDVMAEGIPLAKPHVWQFRAAAGVGSGHFTDSGQSLGKVQFGDDVALGDVDLDGDLDALTTFSQSSTGRTNKVWLNNGTGTFSDSGQILGGKSGRDVALGDLDGDGDLDAFIVFDGLVGQANEVWLNQGGVQAGTVGTFRDSGQSLGDGYSMDVALGDLDGDGDLDAFVGNDGGNKVWLNQGGAQGGTLGIFRDSGQSLRGSWGVGVSLGDLDRDGDLDAFIAEDGPNTVWLNNGAGVFTSTTQSLGSADSRDVALGDLDGDGDLDAYVANSGGTHWTGWADKVWLNQGNGMFSSGWAQSRPIGLSYGVALGDLDGDGDLDAFIAGNTNKAVWLNNGAGIFSLGWTPSLPFVIGTDVALGDLDGDGDLDAFVPDCCLPKNVNRVWRNANPIPISGGIVTPSPGVTITVPSGTFTDTVVLDYMSRPITYTGSLKNVGIFYDLSAAYQSNGQPANLQPGKRYTITVKYRQEDVPPGANEADLALYYKDGTNWVKEPTSVVDTVANTITATPNHFSLWGALVEGTVPDHHVYLPLILKQAEDRR